MSESPERPTEDLVWATAGTKTEPSGPRKSTGWEDEDAPPFDEFNWRWDAEDQWFDYMQEMVGRSYTTALGAAGAAISAPIGTRVTLLRDNPETLTAPITVKGTIGTTVGFTVRSMDSDCGSLYFAEGDGSGSANVYSYDTSTAGVTQNWVKGLSEGFPTALHTDGNLIAVSSSTAAGASGTDGLTIIRASDGTVISFKETGVSVYTAYPDGNSAVGGALNSQVWYLKWTGVTGNPIKRWESLGDSVADVVTHAGAWIWDICNTTDAVFSVTGNDSDTFRVRGYRKTADKTAISSSGFVITAQSDGVGHGGPFIGAKICSDGKTLFLVVGGPAGVLPKVWAFPAIYDGNNSSLAPLWTLPVGATTGSIDSTNSKIACDDRYVYVCAEDRFLMLDKHTGAVLREVTYAGATSHDAPRALGVDVERVWLGGGNGAGYQGVESYSTARYSSVWRRVETDPSAVFAEPENYQLWRKLLSPIDGGSA